MDKAAEDLREAMDRYFWVQAVAFVRRKAKGPADPGFEPLSDDELAALEELVSAIEDVREGRRSAICLAPYFAPEPGPMVPHGRLERIPAGPPSFCPLHCCAFARVQSEQRNQL